jgi:hypothetical protein
VKMILSTTTKQILRWLAVLPGAILASVVVLFPIHWAAMFIHHFGDGSESVITVDGKGLLQSMPLESLERFGDALFVPGAIVAISAHIAPRFHLGTAIVVTGLLVVLMALLFTQAHIDDSPFRIVIAVVLWIVSITVALFHARNLDKGA